MSETSRPRAAGRFLPAQALEAVVAASPLPIISVDLHGCVLSWNPAATELFGWQEKEVVGTPLPVIPPDWREQALQIRTQTEAGKTYRDVEVLRQRRDGTLVRLSLSTAPVVDAQGRLAGTMFIYVDLTARKAAEDALRQQAEALRERAALLELTQEAIFVRELETGMIRYWNRGSETLYGWTSEEAVGAISHELLQTVFPEPLSAVEETLRRTGRWRGDLIHTTKAGRELVVASRWALYHDEGGTPVAALEVNTDVTHARQLEEALRESRERAETSFEHAAVGMALVGTDGRFLRVNGSLCVLLGYTKEELGSLNFQDITHPDDLTADLEYVRQMLAGEIRTYQMEKRYVRKDGQVVWGLLSVSLVHDAHGQPRYFVSQIQDITTRKLAESVLEHQAHHDPLTGLANRVALQQQLQLALQRAGHEGGVLALLFLDLDGFKAINDELGHEEGDAILVRIAECLVGAVRVSDTVARLAGDEFVVILPGIGSRRNAVAIAKKLLETLQQLTAGPTSRVVSASVGVSVYPFDAQTPEQLLHAADIAMYRAKSQGKNRYALYSERQSADS